MGPSSELSLDLKPSFSLKTTPMAGFLRDVSTIGDGFQKLTKVDEYVACLEEERKKIDAFKRELPLCMSLLNDAIEGLKAEKKQCRSNEARPVLEEFIPIRSKFNEEEGVKKEKEEFRDKMNWMSSAQLWSDNCTDKNKKSLERVEEANRLAMGDPISESKYRNRGGAFMPFKGFSGFPGGKEEKEVLLVPELSLLSSSLKSVSTESGSTALCSKGSKSNAQSSLQSQQQARKARRCWSPELHRRFINALQQLGGAQVATPKQIRELMKVEGLTNDEVKSHLQKYRLHTRKLPSSTSTSSNQSLVLLRGIWGSDDHYESSKPSTSQSGSPQGPLQLAGTTRGISHTGGDSCEEEEEEEEEEKSESFSWKGHRIRSGEYDTE